MAKMQESAGTAGQSSPSPSTATPAASVKPAAADASSTEKVAEPAKKVIRIDRPTKPASSKANGKAKVEDGAVEEDDEVEEIRTAGAARAPAPPPPSGLTPPGLTPEMLASMQERMKDPAAMKVRQQGDDLWHGTVGERIVTRLSF